MDDPAGDETKGSGRWRWVILALGVSFFLTLLVEATATTRAPIWSYDEGIILTSASRIAEGEVPYRDYDPVYGPLEPALVAAAGWVSGGPQLWVLRAIRRAAITALVLLVAACVATLGGRLGALGAALGVIGATSGLTHPGLAALLATALVLARGLEGDSQRWLFGAGLSVGLTGLLRPEWGGLALATTALVTLGWGQGPLKPRALRLAALAAGVIPAGIVYLVLFGAAGSEEVLAHFARTRAQLEFRTLPYPIPPAVGGLEGLWIVLLAGLPPLVALVAVPLLGWRWLRAWRGEGEAPPALLLILAALALGTLPYGFWRSDAFHLLPAWVFAVCLVGAAVGRFEARISPPRARRLLWAATTAIAALILVRLGAALQERAKLTPAGVPGLAGIRLEVKQDLAFRALVAEVTSRTRPGSKIFVGCGQHRRLIATDALLYVLCQRRVAVRQHCFRPGVTTTEPVQREIVSELAEVELVVLSTEPYREEPNRSRELGSGLLDAVIAREFRQVAEVDGYRILVRTR